MSRFKRGFFGSGWEVTRSGQNGLFQNGSASKQVDSKKGYVGSGRNGFWSKGARVRKGCLRNCIKGEIQII